MCPDLTPFFVAFDRECKAIQQAVMQLSEYRAILPFALKAANAKLEEIRRRRRGGASVGRPTVSSPTSPARRSAARCASTCLTG